MKNLSYGIIPGMNEKVLIDTSLLNNLGTEIVQRVFFVLFLSVCHQYCRSGQKLAQTVDDRLTAVISASRMHI